MKLFKVLISQSTSLPSLSFQGFWSVCLHQLLLIGSGDKHRERLLVCVFGKHPLCPVVALACGKSELAALGELKQDFSCLPGSHRLVKTNDFSLFVNEVCFAVPVSGM